MPVSPLDDTNDNWYTAVQLFTGYPLPKRSTVFDTLKGNNEIPLMKVEISKKNMEAVDPHDLHWIVENAGWRIENTDFVIPFYIAGGNGAQDDVSMHKARITLLGTNGHDVPAGGIDMGGKFASSYKLGDSPTSWDSAPWTQYAYGGGLALMRLMDTPNTTKDFSWNNLLVDQKDAVDLGSFTSAADAFDRSALFFKNQLDQLQTWENALGKEDSSWRGNAAGLFWDLVHILRKKYEAYDKKLRPGGGATSAHGDALRQARQDFMNAAGDLYNAWNSWQLQMGNPLRWLYDDLADIANWVWDNNITHINHEFNYTAESYSDSYSTDAGFLQDLNAPRTGPLGRLDDIGTWKKVGEHAVGQWQQSIRDNLETPASHAMTVIYNSWGSFKFPEVKSTGDETLKDFYAQEQSDLAQEKADAAAAKAAADAKAAQDKYDKDKADADAKAAKDKADADAKEAAAEAKYDKDKQDADAKAAKDKADADAKEAAATAKYDKDKADADAKAAKDKADADAKEAAAEAKYDKDKQDAEAQAAKDKADADAKEAAAQAQYDKDKKEALNLSSGLNTDTGTPTPEQVGYRSTMPLNSNDSSSSSVTNPDGSTSLLNPDGSVTTTFPDGSTTTVDPNAGISTVTLPDGSTITAPLNPGDTGTSSVTNPNGSTSTLNPDGSVTTKFPDGSTTTVDPNAGTSTVTLPNGTSVTSPLNGGGTVVGPDGSTSVVNSDGSVTTTYPDGSVRTVDPTAGTSTLTLPDGTSVTTPLNPGGSVVSPDGSTTTLNPGGTVTTTYPDGSSMTIDPNAGTSTITQPDGTSVTSPLNPAQTSPTLTEPTLTTPTLPDTTVTTPVNDPTANPTVTIPSPTVTTPTVTIPPATVHSLNPVATTSVPTLTTPSLSSGTGVGGGIGSSTTLNGGVSTSSDPGYDDYEYQSPYSPATLTPPATATAAAASSGTPLNSGGFPPMSGGTGGAGSGSGSGSGERVRNVMDETGVTTRGAGNRRGRAATRAAQRVEDEEEALVPGFGRGTATTSGGMPYLPGAGGGPGQTQTQSSDRERGSWAEEDDDVWGTDEGGAPAVIGR
ncbi:AAWKG family protein [Streptomyces sp. STR69]|uniref:AAWKG family protein n=1 Tax=Streptomyces sp. STR69 TaxID=1796942 RepID=UPI0021C70F66|nr:AAWKG family protein [Streptomyces sp. STR69]